MLKRHPHTPAHLQADDTPYFFTGAVLNRMPLLRSPEVKARLIARIEECFRRFDWALHDWVVLDDHYHLLGHSRLGADLPRMMQCLHGGSAVEINVLTGHTGPVWWNYWDHCPRNEADYRVRQNYLFHNPIKHGYVTDLRDYPHSTFPRLLELQGREALAGQFRTHSGFRDLDLDEDDFCPPECRL